MSRRGAASIVASPVLVGAVSVLVSIVAIILSYNANAGLPFVPTYVISATLPSGGNLVEGNEVRAGGFRIGVVDRIGSQQVKNSRGEDKAVAVMRLKLDKIVEELPLDSKVISRPRSVLGLKFLEITPGSSPKTFRPGSTIPLKNAEGPVEVDDFFNTFQEDVRDNNQSALQGFGDALAGRGPSINEALHEFVPFFVHLGPVMRSLSAPRTELDRFFKEIGETTGDLARSCARGTGPRLLPEGATDRTTSSALDAQSPACSSPVAVVQARLFSEMADTFEAFGRDPQALRAFIEDTAPTTYVSRRSFTVQKPFLADTAELFVRLEPAAEEIPRSLPKINDALVAGTEVLPRTVRLNRNTEELLRALERLGENPNTLLALKDLRQTVGIGAQFAEYIAPYQTVCNYWNYMWTFLADDVGDVRLAGGTAQRVLARTAPNNFLQDDSQGDSLADRPADVPSDLDPQRAQVSDLAGVDDLQDELDDQLREIEELVDELERLPQNELISNVPGLSGALQGLFDDTPVGMTVEQAREAIAQLRERFRDQVDELQEALDQDLTAFHNSPYSPAIDGQGRADCQIGNVGYARRLVSTGRYPPSTDPQENGGSNVVMDANAPGLHGTTFSGIERLQDVDDEQRSRHPRGEVPEDTPQKPDETGVVPGEPDRTDR